MLLAAKVTQHRVDLSGARDVGRLLADPLSYLGVLKLNVTLRTLTAE